MPIFKTLRDAAQAVIDGHAADLTSLDEPVQSALVTLGDSAADIVKLIDDQRRLEFLLARMYRVEADRYFENGQPRQEWHVTEFSIPRGAVAVDDFMRDMRAVIDAASAR